MFGGAALSQNTPITGTISYTSWLLFVHSDENTVVETLPEFTAIHCSMSRQPDTLPISAEDEEDIDEEGFERDENGDGDEDEEDDEDIDVTEEQDSEELSANIAMTTTTTTTTESVEEVVRGKKWTHTHV